MRSGSATQGGSNPPNGHASCFFCGISETASHFTVYEVAPDRPRYTPPMYGRFGKQLQFDVTSNLEFDTI